ncbi:glycosyltransferase [Psychroflexus halocasei]|uniref:Glycosyltransferase involved in cell wall bisynthesis n=1 Tax=Psychroflexus halocasei TaxID=908615 RepID=A0A1H4C3R7_9FLAO|nr:glycosyltransferase [Psychroflexus halocasei]SEA55051.1 Glycosyltransferase involved in cell wall bisynthesis [Psychroflexus halocasei]
MKKQNQKSIRAVQIIDSLDAGGGERMAVNLANSLSSQIEASCLMVTRKEGLLRQEVSEKVNYIFLSKKKAVDFKALKKAKRFIKKHQITHLHAHSTSFFFATLLKISCPHLKLIWHDHYGESENLANRPKSILRISSIFFNSIIAVNQKLEDWSLKYLFTKNVNYVKNFTTKNTEIREGSSNLLIKNKYKHHLIQVANIRPQKDHLNILKALQLLSKESIKLHLLGQYNKDDQHYKNLKQSIKDLDVENQVEFYGSVENVQLYLKEADLAILSSRSEGLPLALLEYAMAQKPVVLTDVGQCAEVVGEHAKLVKPNHHHALAKAIIEYLSDPILAERDALNLYQRVRAEYGEEAIINKLLKIYEKA